MTMVMAGALAATGLSNGVYVCATNHSCGCYGVILSLPNVAGPAFSWIAKEEPILNGGKIYY